MSWWVVVSNGALSRETALVAWEVGADRWVDRLKEAGKLKVVKMNSGYPNEYLGSARDILPLLHGLERQLPGELFTKHPDRIDACPQETELTVRLWDQS